MSDENKTKACSSFAEPAGSVFGVGYKFMLWGILPAEVVAVNGDDITVSIEGGKKLIEVEVCREEGIRDHAAGMTLEFLNTPNNKDLARRVMDSE